MALSLRGFGTAVPETRTSQTDALGLARVLCCRTDEQLTWVPLMYTQTGIEHRYTILPRQLIDDVPRGTRESGSVFLPTGSPEDNGPTTGQRMAIYEKEAGALAVRSAHIALQKSGLSASAITHIVTVSCTGFQAPGVDFAVMKALGLRGSVARTNVGFMGCHGALNGLRVAAAYTGADPGAAVLLCAVELSSLHYHYGWDPQRIVANAIFGDGAAAVVGTGVAPAGEWTLRASGSCCIPDTSEAMGWTVGDHGFEMRLSKNVPRLLARNVGPWVESWLKEYDLTIADIKTWAIHPGGPKILESVEEGLGLPREATRESRAIFSEYGNMSSPTVLFVLDRLRSKGAERPCVALGFGPGLAAEGALFL